MQEVRTDMNESNLIRHLSQSISEHLDTKSLTALAQRVHSLGMPIKQVTDLDSIVKTVAQVVANLLDQILLAEQKERENQIERHSTLQSSPNCLNGKLHLAALIFTIFCPRLSIWNILDLISAARKELREAEVLQQVKLKEQRVVYPPNLRNNYSCPCLIFNEEPSYSPSMQRLCSFCRKQYHGQCQVNSLFCNCCFLRFCMFDMREEMGDPYNHSKEVQMVYFTYMENAFRLPHAADNDCIFFYVVHFTLPDMNNMKKKQRNFYIKMARSDRIFTGQLGTSLRRKSWRGETKQFWDLDGINYYLYLNHNELKITNEISDCAVIFKVVPRVLLATTNILVIKCVKRNMKYAFTQAQIPYLYREDERKEKVVMLGIYQTNKVRSSQLKNKLVLEQLSRNMIPAIGIAHSVCYLEYVLKNINNIECQLVDLIDVNSRQKIVNPVRSYSCTHLQCFDFEAFRQKVRPNLYKSKPLKKNNKQPIDVDESDNQEEKKVINLDSSEQLPPNKPVAVPRRPLTPLQRRKLFMRKKRQRQRRQKDCLFCPICSKRMLSLYIDPLFKSILVNSGFYTKARVYSNGEYKFQGVCKMPLPT